MNVVFASDSTGDVAHAAVAEMKAGSSRVVLLENLRFHPEETSKNRETRQEFAVQLAELGEKYVSDGFGVAHRSQASVTELAALLPSAAGLLIEREVKVLEQLTEHPVRPYCVVLGGSKVSDKLGVIDHLLSRVDTLLIGGGMLFTFLAAQGLKVGASLQQPEEFAAVHQYLAKAEELGVSIMLPQDVLVAETFSPDAAFEVVPVAEMESTRFGAAGIGLDIGPQTARLFAEHIARAQTAFWNGPMGVFEFENFSHGTRAIAQALTQVQGLSVVGGGDSAAAIRTLGFSDDQFGHISTGGGASLEFLEGKRLPGLEAIGWQP